MRETTLVRRNALRNPVRMLLMVGCIAVAFLIFGVLSAVATAFRLEDQPGAHERMMVVNRNGFQQTLPIAYARDVARQANVAVSSPVRMALVYWRQPKDIVSAVMVEPETYLGLSKDVVKVADEDRARFVATRDGLLVGRALAERYGWKRGDQVTLQSFTDLRDDGTRAWRFTVAGIYTAAQPGGSELAMAGHFAYYNEALLTGRDRINWVLIQGRDLAANDAMARTIDTGYANSAAATRTQSEAALGRAFLSQIGDLMLIVRLIVGAAFVVILCVVGNTLIFMVGERTGEIGVLKTLGFSRLRVARIFAGEVALIAVAGAVAGMSVAALIVSALATALKDVLPGMAMGASTFATAAGLVALLILLTGILPVLQASRVNIVEALGRK
ncbi:ABC transporter permease [Sphingomonas psychrotolerans]|nr:FtsX-like permease family protein [Sphingomonas psychrotolerans]